MKKIAGISFEVFPPKKDDEFEKAYEVLNQLNELEPEFISVTYGAGGSRSKKTIELSSYIQNDLKREAICHMTCVGATKQSILENCEDMQKAGINRVLALRGDRPRDMSDEQFLAREFEHASDLIQFIKENTDMHVAAACYIEKHPESKSLQDDMQYMKLKQDAGAEEFISQMFFDNALFYDFMDQAKRIGIHRPVHAGIMPITSAKQLGTTVSLSGSSVPKALSDLFAKYADCPEDMRKAGIDYAVRQIQDLRAQGHTDIHIYSMNKPKMTREILEAL